MLTFLEALFADDGEITLKFRRKFNGELLSEFFLSHHICVHITSEPFKSSIELGVRPGTPGGDNSLLEVPFCVVATSS